MMQQQAKANDHADFEGTDGTGGGSEYEETKEVFIERFTEICDAAGVAVSKTLETLIDAFATEVADYAEWLTDEDASRRRIRRQLEHAGVALEEVTNFKLTVINGGKSG
jgi:hypothetical protein